MVVSYLKYEWSCLFCVISSRAGAAKLVYPSRHVWRDWCEKMSESLRSVTLMEFPVGACRTYARDKLTFKPRIDINQDKLRFLNVNDPHSCLFVYLFCLFVCFWILDRWFHKCSCQTINNARSWWCSIFSNEGNLIILPEPKKKKHKKKPEQNRTTERKQNGMTFHIYMMVLFYKLCQIH